jgi:hypothetical protein
MRLLRVGQGPSSRDWASRGEEQRGESRGGREQRQTERNRLWLGLGLQRGSEERERKRSGALAKQAEELQGRDHWVLMQTSCFSPVGSVELTTKQ